MTEFLTLGLVLGLSAGFSPGPLLALVVSETLRHGVKNGLRVAVSPVFTDLPIILLTLLVLSRLADHQPVLGIIALLGGAFILYMGIDALRTKGMTLDTGSEAPRSLRKGILVNFLSPHPYLFWLTVGGALMGKALERGMTCLVVFLAAFYLALVGAKVVTALLVGRSRTFLGGPVYRTIMRLLGLALCVLALLLFRDGLNLLGL